MISIAALDDDEKWIITEKLITEQIFLENEYEFLGYTKIEDFLVDLERKKCDIYLLDMELPETNGFSIGKAIKDFHEKAIIVYITNHVQYAIEAFEVNAFRYIPKNMLEEKLPEAYQAITDKIKQRREEYLIISSERHMERIPISDIYYLIKSKKYVIIKHKGGICKVRATLERIHGDLNKKSFLKIDKGCIVNIIHIMSLEHYQVKMRNGEFLPVSQPRLKNVKESIAAYWGELQ